MKDKSINELFKMSQEGNKQARDYLVESNMGLVYKIANSYRNKIDLDTAVQEGSIGLIKAIDRFEPERGFKFSTYAVPMIDGCIRAFIKDYREDRPYRIKREDSALYIKIRNAEIILTRKLNREPTLKEVSKYVDASIQKVNRVINAVENFTSLQDTKYHNKDGKQDILIIDSISEQNIPQDQVINKIVIEKSLETLTKKQRDVISLRYFKEYSQAKTGQVLNISQAQISRIERKALKLLKEVI